MMPRPYISMRTYYRRNMLSTPMREHVLRMMAERLTRWIVGDCVCDVVCGLRPATTKGRRF